MAGQRDRRAVGQAGIETIVIIVLVSLALVIGVGLYGRQVFTAFSCAAQSIAEGRISFSCPKSTKDEDEEAEPVDAGATGQSRVAAEPGGGTGSGAASGGSADQKLRDAKELLKSTKSGRDVLKFLDDTGIPIELRGGDGSFFSPKDKKIVINGAKTVEQIALTAAHEVNHSIFDHEGKGANIDTDSRDDFVRKSLEEEAIGTVASIGLKRELQAAGKTITATYPLEKQFNTAFDKAVDDLKKSKPSATAADLDAAGNAAGLDAVVNGLKTGKVVTSTTKETYPVFYGRQFDAKHAPKAPEPGATDAKAAEAAKPEPSAFSSEGDTALALFRDREKALRERVDPEVLDAAIAKGQDDPAKARADFVKRSVDAVVVRNFEQIDFKRKLQQKGAIVTTPLPLENEFTVAFTKAFAEEVGKNRAGKAVGAGNTAAAQAVRAAVESGKIVAHTNEKFADHFGRIFDEKQAEFARQNPALVKQKEDERKRREGIEALAELVNKVDPKSPEADKAIALVGAIVPLLRRDEQIIFVFHNAGVQRLLGPFGFRRVFGSGVPASLQLDRFEYALGNHARLDPRDRELLRHNPDLAGSFGIKTTPTAAELEFEDGIVAIRKLPDGTTHNGRLDEFRVAVVQNRINHDLEQLQAIRGGGPGALLGRIIGCAREGVAMGPCGENEAAIGGAADNLLFFLAGRKALQNVRKGRGGGGAEDFIIVRRGRNSGAEIRPAPVRNRAEEAPRRPGDNLVLNKPRPGEPVKPQSPAKTQPQVALEKTQPAPPPKPQRPQQQQQQQQQQKKSQPGQQAQPPAGNRGGQETGVGGRPANTGQGTRIGQETAQDSVTEVQRVQQRQQRQQQQQQAADAKAKFDRAIENLARKGEKLTVDRLIEGIEGNEFGGVAISQNRERHRQAFKDNRGKQLPEPQRSRDGEPPIVFPDRIDNMPRIDASRVSPADLKRLQLAIANKHPPGDGGGGGGPPANTRGQGALDSTGQNTRGQGALDNTQPPPPKPQSPPKINMGQQGKHIVGHNNFIPGRSILRADPLELAKKAGTGAPVGKVPRGQPGFKERVDFSPQIIGDFVKDGVATPTTKGIIHYGKDGIHIVPAAP